MGLSETSWIGLTSRLTSWHSLGYLGHSVDISNAGSGLPLVVHNVKTVEAVRQVYFGLFLICSGACIGASLTL